MSLLNIFKREIVWKLDEETLALVRMIEEIAKSCDLHIALGGSVLHKGQSTKDLDLYVYPHFHEIKRRDLHDFADCLRENDITGWRERTRQQTDVYEVNRVFYTAEYKGKRIEFFIAGFPEEI